MIASICGKKPHVYRVIILKQMADHTFQGASDFLFKANNENLEPSQNLFKGAGQTLDSDVIFLGVPPKVKGFEPFWREGYVDKMWNVPGREGV